MIPTLIKLTFISGLKDIVLNEIKQYPDLHLVQEGAEEMYIKYIPDFKNIRKLRSVLNMYAVKQSTEFNPRFLSNHKSMLGDLIDVALKGSADTFRSFKLSCAGSESKEVREIENFIVNTYKLKIAEDADMEIYIGKLDKLWEAGVRLTARPLSLRDYKVENIKGGMNPTIAYAMNTFCDLNSIHSYMNVFSGSATLLIEAGLSNPNIKLLGFDINGKTNALAVKNIKKAGLIKLIQFKTADIFDKPDLGKFDVITSDLPFGMKISKDEDLDKLYRCFVDYCGEVLNPEGVLVVYTTEYELLDRIFQQSKFSIIRMLDLKVSTSVNAYIYPKIFVCKLKK